MPDPYKALHPQWGERCYSRQQLPSAPSLPAALNPALTSPVLLLCLPGPAPCCRHRLVPGSGRPLGSHRAVGRAPLGSASGSSYIPGGQRLLGNGQSHALKFLWVRPTELLGLLSTLPDVTPLLHKRDSERGSRAPGAFREAPRTGLELRCLFSRWQD